MLIKSCLFGDVRKDVVFSDLGSTFVGYLIKVWISLCSTPDNIASWQHLTVNTTCADVELIITDSDRLEHVCGVSSAVYGGLIVARQLL